MASNEAYAEAHIKWNCGALRGDPPSVIPTYVATVHRADTAATLHRTAFYLHKVQGPLLDLRWTIPGELFPWSQMFANATAFMAGQHHDSTIVSLSV